MLVSAGAIAAVEVIARGCAIESERRSTSPFMCGGLVCTSGARNSAATQRVLLSSVDASLRHNRCAGATFTYGSVSLTGRALLPPAAKGAHFFL